jgi:cytochrome c-type biogenesis protein
VLTLAADASVQHTVLSGSLLLALPIALVAGLVSFLSPCVLPLVPGYLSYVTGVSGADLETARRGRMVAGAMLFVLGFTAVFVSGGAAFGFLGLTLLAHQRAITIALGSLTILLGLSFMGVLPGLNREWRLHRRPAVGLAGAPMLGLLFGLGWTPCIGPTFAAVNTLSIEQGSAARGAVLAVAYCLGLGIPFVLAALGFRRALGAFGVIKRHHVWVMRIGGGMLVLVGVLLVSGAWAYFIHSIQTWVGGFSTPI